VRRTSVVVFAERSRYHAAPFSEVEATMSDIFNERAVALVDLFFAERDEELLANLRARAADVSNVAALREHTGISDDQVLADLVGLGVTSETLTAFSLVPMFAVARSMAVQNDAPMPIEAGQTSVTVTVNGTVQMAK
jgi:hypothetical protein